MLKLPFCAYPTTLIEEEDFRLKQTFRPIPSLALAFLCAFCEKYKSLDYKLKAVDINIEAYTAPGDPIDLSLYPKILSDCIKNNSYDVLALSIMLVYNHNWLNDAVRLSRKYHPGSKIIVGGGFPTIFPEKVLKNYDTDDVVIGEGETSFLHILNKYNNHHDANFESKFPFEGYATKDANGNIKVIPREKGFILSMKDFPPPAWKYLNVEKYFKNSGDKILPIEGSRGCPYNCSYCATNLSWGRKVRYKSVDNLIKEIKETSKKYGSPTRHFVDDNISISKEWVVEFLNKLIDLKLSHEISFSNFSVRHLD